MHVCTLGPFETLHRKSLLTAQIQRSKVDIHPSNDWSVRPYQIGLKTLQVQLDYGDNRNMYLWHSVTFPTLALSWCNLYSYFLTEVERFISWVPMAGHYLKLGGIWTSSELTQCTGVKKQQKKNAVRAFSYFSLPALLSFSFLFVSCFHMKNVI